MLLMIRVMSVAKLVVEIPKPLSVTSNVIVGLLNSVNVSSAGTTLLIVGLTMSGVGVGVGLAVGVGVAVGVGAGVAGPLPIVNTEVATVLFPPWFTASIRKLNGTP